MIRRLLLFVLLSWVPTWSQDIIVLRHPAAAAPPAGLSLYDSTSVAETIYTTAGKRWVRVYTMVAPANKTANVVATPSNTADYAVLGCQSFTNVDQSTPLGTAVKASGTSSGYPSLAVSSATSDMVMGVISCDGGGDEYGCYPSGDGVTVGWVTLGTAWINQGDSETYAGDTSITSLWGVSPGTYYAALGFNIIHTGSAVSVDNAGAGVGGANVTSGAGLTLSNFAVGSGSNRLLVCGISSWESTDRTWTVTF